MALVIDDVATFAVPENLILLYVEDEQVKGKLHDGSSVDVSSDDLLRLDVAAGDLPCFAFYDDYSASHSKAAINNPAMRSAFAQSAAAAYTKFVADQKVSKATFLTKVYELSEMIESVDNAAISVTGSNAIEVSGEGTEKTIALNIDGKTLSQSASGLKSELTIVKQTNPESGYAATYYLADADGVQISGSQKINITKDKFLKGAGLVWGTSADLNNGSVVGEVASKSSTAIYPFVKLEVYVNEDGSDANDTSVATVYIPADELFHDYSAGNGLVINDQVISVVIDASQGKVRIAATPDGVTAGSAQDTGLVDVLSVSANGVKVDNIQAAIDYAIGVEAAARQAADADLDARKTEREMVAIGGGRALIFNENDGGGTKVEHPLVAGDGNKFWTYIGLNDNAHTGVSTDDVLGQIYAVNTGVDADTGKTGYGLRLNLYKNRLCYFNGFGSGEASNNAQYELAIKKDVTTLQTTISTAIGDASESEAGDGSVYGYIKSHEALDTRHNAVVQIVRTANDPAEPVSLEYKEYICKAALTAVLPEAPADGTKRIVSIVAGGEGTTVAPSGNDTLAGGSTAVACNVSNDTITFVYDATAADWMIL